MRLIDWLKPAVCREEIVVNKALNETVSQLKFQNASQAETISNLMKAQPKQVLPPELEFTTSGYSGERRIKTKNHDYRVTTLRNYDYFSVTTLLYDALLKTDLSFSTPVRERFNAILGWVQENVKYQYDAMTYGAIEVFQFSWETLKMGQGDCEDAAYLTIDLATAAGLPKDKLFVAFGHLDDTGHAFPVLYDGGEFWVGEATTGKKTGALPWSSKLVKENYKADWGLCSPAFRESIKFKAGSEPWGVV